MRLFWRLIIGEPGLGQELFGHYDPFLVLMSIAVACLAGFAALSVADRIKASKNASAKRIWLAAGAGSMGAGIWAMHFTAMLAFSMHGPVRYDLWVTLASVLPAMIGSGIALHFLARPAIGWQRLQVGALLMATGIGTMHYLGMEAMRMHAVLYYDLTLFVLSIVVAHVLAMLALYIEFVLRAKVGLQGEWVKGAAAVVMGFAVAGMHYTAMAAARFYPGTPGLAPSGLIFSPLSMAGTIIVITSFIMTCAIIAARINRQLQEASKTIEETEARERSVLEAMVDGMILTDSEGIIESVNPAACRMFGYDSAELQGQHINKLLPTTTYESSGSSDSLRILENSDSQHTRMECLGLRKDTTRFPVEMSISEYKMKTRRRISRLVGDITERKMAEAALREAHKETEQLLSSISSILIGVDHDDRITRWNEAARKAFGIDETAVVGKSILDCGLQWDWNELQKRVADCRDKDQPTDLHEIQFTRPDGKEGFLNITINPIAGEAKQQAGYLLLATEITDRKNLESQLSQAQKLESIGQLAAGIAHEINTPIQYIGDNTRFLEDAFSDFGKFFKKVEEIANKDKNDHFVQEVMTLRDEVDLDYLLDEAPLAIGQSLEGLEHVAKIVRAMKEFSHPGTQEKTLTDLNKALENTLTVASNEWKYLAEMVTDLDASLPLVPCLPAEINQVFLNLIVNAAHAIADSVEEASGKKGTITIRTRHKNGWAEIRISDTGKGIPEEIKSRIFDPFFTTKEVGKGTGQGLAISHNVVVEKHGGFLDFETELEKGTSFFVNLPIKGDLVLGESDQLSMADAKQVTVCP